MMREKCTEESRHSMPGNGHTKKENRGIPRGTEHTKKGRDVDVRNANEMRTVEEANKRLIVQRCPTKWKDTPARKAAWRVCKG